MQKKKLRLLSIILCVLFAAILSSCNTSPVEVSYAVDNTKVAKEVEYGTEFNLRGLVVTAQLSNGANYILANGTEGYSVDDGGYDKVTPGEYTITIRYKDYDDVEFVITVLEEEIIEDDDDDILTVKAVNIETDSAKLLYYLGGEFDASGIIVKKVFSDDSEEVIDISQYDIDSSKYVASIAGNYEIKVSLKSDAAIFAVYTVTVTSLAG